MNAVLDLAAEVIAAADRAHPADAVLRDQLRARKRLGPGQAREVAGAVFGYFRWRGWLELKQPLSRQIEQAGRLSRRFSTNPGSFADAELTERSVPAWARQELEVTPALARALQAEPKLWIRARPGTAAQLAKSLGEAVVFAPARSQTASSSPDQTSRDAIEYRGGEDLFRNPQFRTGQFELQDLSSQAVSLVCNPEPGETWWDACAGEGGKLLHLSDLMHNKGLIWASDRAAWRLQKLKRRAARAHVFNYRAVPWDGGGRLPTRTRFDGVLVDAPCSGVGTWGRNPHARWTTQPSDVSELSQTQKQLLLHAATAVKTGGKLVYAACTLTPSETVEVADVFELECPGFRSLPFRNPVAPSQPPASRLTIQPQDFGSNGMFLAAWVRTV